MSTEKPTRLRLVETETKSENLICWEVRPNSYLEMGLNCFATFLLLLLENKLTNINQEFETSHNRDITHCCKFHCFGFGGCCCCTFYCSAVGFILV